MVTESPRVVLVDSHREWPADLLSAIGGQGYAIVRIDDVRLAPFFVLSGGVAAVIIDSRGLDMGALVALRECREHTRALAVVVVALEPAPAAMKKALDSGATALLPWPASPELLGQALRCGWGERCS